ncbi:hypothetical protein DID88_004285 [Monilinia fructigena]|uniref:protein-tyrosine-phosphatase n=1 Tax=Monilinia fructigena TaxID=38457 RepID=A0A395IT08_9HELO|nr:hypothetical protein DID88_004285 [Monilinia fructigena]
MPPSSQLKYGQIIEYIPDRLYLASYTTTPSPDTLFPYPEQQSSKRSPTKRSARAADGPSVVADKNREPPHYFSIDDTLLYNAFHHDFGPLHIGHLYRFAVQFHDILGAPENKNKPVVFVFWSKADARSRANAACLLATYMVLIQSWAPHLALAPIAQADPPLMPFRDAGYSQADYGITVQDVVYGVWRAKEQGFCALPQFDLEDLCFPTASPSATNPSFFPTICDSANNFGRRGYPPNLTTPFKNVLKHFTSRNIGLVVRLNSELYSPSFFTSLGIEHLDMIFDDGTCPPLAVVRKFITLAHEMITVQKRGIAVHCKAGLGRTGCLIGAYLIYRYGFTANEIIAYMRFMRPGMVVGPQQHWLHLNQGTFREWWIEEQFELRMKEKLANMAPVTPRKGHFTNRSQVVTPPNGNQRTRLEDYLPAPTPGQPRKTGRLDRHHPYGRHASAYSTTDDENTSRETEVISIHRSSTDATESEEEWQLRMRTTRKSSRSPTRSERSGRSISQTTTTIYTSIDDSSYDVENIGSGGRPKTPSTVKSGSGSLGKVRGSPKRSGDSLRNKETSGAVRKTSGELGVSPLVKSPACK